MKFFIDNQFLCSVDVVKDYGIYDSKPSNELTADQLVNIIKGTNRYKTHYMSDHPEFTALRNNLENSGYIKTTRGWVNGDVVLKPFYLNGLLFDIGSRFCCAAALKITFELAARRVHGHGSKIV